MRAPLSVKLVALLLLAPLALAATPSWETRAGSPEPGGFGEALVGFGPDLYVVKGYSATSAQDFWRYSPGSDTWSILGTSGLPAGTFRNGATLDTDGGDKLYALAGARYEDANRREFWQYSFSSSTWTRKANTPAPQGAGDAAAWSSTDGALYALLGSKSHGAKFAKYVPASNSWKTLAAPPAGIDDGASLEHAGGRYLFALRGEFFETSPPVMDFWRYDTQTNKWSTMAPIPEPDGVGDGGSLLWGGANGGTMSDLIFALGGNSPDETPGCNAYRYSISANAWTTIADVPHCVGSYNGNRLGYAGGHVHYWQGSPSAFSGGGDEVARLLNAAG